jgi:hypothetical protein
MSNEDPNSNEDEGQTDVSNPPAKRTLSKTYFSVLNWDETNWDSLQNRTYEEDEFLHNSHNIHGIQYMMFYDKFTSTKSAHNRPFLPSFPVPSLQDGALYDHISHDQNLKSIRLLRLTRLSTSTYTISGTSPEKWPGYMECTLHTFNFPECPEYTALSYVWGSDSPELFISVNGHPFAVRQNLFAALCQFCEKDDISMYLWIDAICINQSDNTEKSYIVQHMGAIFKHAHRVRAWLGRSLPHNELWRGNKLVEQLHELGELFWRESSGADYRSGPDVLNVTLVKCLPAILGMFQKSMRRGGFLTAAYAALCQREYWTRIWVLQEVYLAEELHFQIGPKTISLKMLAGAFVLLQTFREYVVATMSRDEIKRNMLLYHFVFHISPFPQMYRLVLYTSLYPPDILSLRIAMTNFCVKEGHKGVRSTDPRDMIYGLLGFATKNEKKCLVPDYQSSVEATYQAITQALLMTGWTDILAWAQQSNKRIKNLPSWVPDYSATIQEAIGSKSQAKKWLPKFEVVPSSILDTGDRFWTSAVISLAGFSVDKIHIIGNVSPRFSHEKAISFHHETANRCNIVSNNQILQFLQEGQLLCQEAERIAALNPTGMLPTARQETSCRVPVADQVTLQNVVVRNPPELSTLYQKALASLKLNNDCGTPIPVDARPYIEAVLLHEDRRIFITVNGYVGLGPDWIEPDDKVVAFYGFNAPYVVRPASNSTFTVVGEVYVHGIMDGELMSLNPETEVFSLG